MVIGGFRDTYLGRQVVSRPGGPWAGMGSAEVLGNAESSMAPQPKSNLVPFSLKIWHLVATISIILRIYLHNFAPLNSKDKSGQKFCCSLSSSYDHSATISGYSSSSRSLVHRKRRYYNTAILKKINSLPLGTASGLGIWRTPCDPWAKVWHTLTPISSVRLNNVRAYSSTVRWSGAGNS